jgi:hypothetical protein
MCGTGDGVAPVVQVLRLSTVLLCKVLSLSTRTGCREVVARLVLEESAVLEMVVKLPACTPLKPPEVECRQQVCPQSTGCFTSTALKYWLQKVSLLMGDQTRSKKVDR